MAGKEQAGKAPRDDDAPVATLPGAGVRETADARAYAEAVIAASQEGLVVLDDAGLVEFANEVFLAIVGRARADVVGRSFAPLVPPDHRDYALERWRAARRGTERSFEIDLQRPDGSRRSVVVGQGRFAHDGRLRIVASVRDITARRRAEIELARHRDRLGELVRQRTAALETANRRRLAEILRRQESAGAYRALLDRSPAGVVVTADGRNALVSHAAAQLVGRPAASLVGMATGAFIAACVHPADRARMARYARLRAAGRHAPGRYVVRMVRPDGTERVAELRMAPIRFRNQPAWQTVVVDVTAQRQTLAELRRRLDVESLLHRVSALLLAARPARPAAAVRGTLAALGRALGAEAALLIASDARRGVARFAGAWFARPPAAFTPPEMRLRDFPWSMGRLPLGRSIVVPDAARLPKRAAAERAVMERMGVRSLAMVPLFSERRFWGSVSLHSTRTGRTWPVADTETARLVGEMAVALLGRTQAYQRLARSERESLAVYQRLPIPLLVWQADGDDLRVSGFNRAFARAWRQRLGLSAGDRLSAALRDRPALAAAVRRCLATRRAVRGAVTGESGRGAAARAVHHFVGPDRVLTRIEDVARRRDLQTAVLRASDAERERIGHDLHDSFGQRLAGIGLLAGALERRLGTRGAPETADAGRLGGWVRDAVAELRQLARGLVPPELEGPGLTAALRRLAEDTGEASGVACRFSVRGRGSVRDAAAARDLYRLAQEAVANAVRHGRPRHIALDLAWSNGGGRLTVEDDGRGFPARRRTRGGLGLRVMRHRAALLGGRLAVRGRAGGGTSLVCTFAAGPPAQRRRKETRP